MLKCASLLRRFMDCSVVSINDPQNRIALETFENGSVVRKKWVEKSASDEMHSPSAWDPQTSATRDRHDNSRFNISVRR